MRADNSRFVRVLRDERGFFLTSFASKGFKLLKGGATIAGRAAGILPPPQAKPAYVPTGTESKAPPATQATSPQPYQSPLDKIKQDVASKVRSVAAAGGSAAADALAKPLLESDAVKERMRTLYIAGGIIGALVLVTLFATLAKK